MVLSNVSRRSNSTASISSQNMGGGNKKAGLQNMVGKTIWVGFRMNSSVRCCGLPQINEGKTFQNTQKFIEITNQNNRLEFMFDTIDVKNDIVKKNNYTEIELCNEINHHIKENSCYYYQNNDDIIYPILCNYNNVNNKFFFNVITLNDAFNANYIITDVKHHTYDVNSINGWNFTVIHKEHLIFLTLGFDFQLSENKATFEKNFKNSGIIEADNYPIYVT